MATELFTRVVRKRTLDEDGTTLSDGKAEDVRLRNPGADWNLIVHLREQGLQDFKQKIQAVFELLSHRFGEAREGIGAANVTTTCATPPCPAIQHSTLGATITKKPIASPCELPSRSEQSPTRTHTQVSEIEVKQVSSENDLIPLLPPASIAGNDPAPPVHIPNAIGNVMETEMKQAGIGSNLIILSSPDSSTDPDLDHVQQQRISIGGKAVWKEMKQAAGSTPESSTDTDLDHIQQQRISISGNVMGKETKQATGSSPESSTNTDLDHIQQHRISIGGKLLESEKKQASNGSSHDLDCPQLPRTSIAGKKRLRSVSLEKLEIMLPMKRLVTEGTGNTGNRKHLQCENFLSNFYARKHDPITAVESVANTVVGHTKTFLPVCRKSIDKMDSRACKQKLAEKVISKQEEEDKRKQELEARKEQERLERIRKREERAKKVMEKNAALRREEDEKKRAHEQKSHVHEVQMKKQCLLQQKTQDIHRRALERHQAAEARKKQEEELKARKLQEMKKAEEIRLEMLEEEKKQKKVDKLNERHVKDVTEKNTLGKVKQEHEERMKLESSKLPEAEAQRILEEAKKEQERKRIEKLFATEIAIKPLSNNKKVPHELSFVPKEQIVQTQGGTKHIPFQVPTPVHNLKNGTTSSYQMTPADPITQYENYSIGDLSSGDSTDEENSPKKPIPDWAHHTKLNKWMENQENSVASNEVNVENIFPPKQLLHTPELEKIFKTKRKCFFVRSSSAKWNSPLLK